MIRSWFFKSLEKALAESELETSGDPEAILAFGRAEELVFTSTELFYTGPPHVNQYFAVEDQTKDTREKVMMIAGSLGAASSSVLLSAVQNSALEAGISLREVEPEGLTECGVTAKMDRTWYVLGDEAALALDEIDTGFSVQTLARQIERDGSYTLYLAQVKPKRLLGVFACSYEISREVKDQVARSKHYFTPVLLSTAKAVYAKAVAKRLGITHCYTDLTKQDKVETIHELSKRRVVFISPHKDQKYLLEGIYRGKKYSVTSDIRKLLALADFSKQWEKRGRRLFQ